MLDVFVILPDNLFYTEEALSIILNDSITHVYVFEDPLYFTAYKYHLSKLTLHRASMRAWYKIVGGVVAGNTTRNTNRNTNHKIIYVNCADISTDWLDYLTKEVSPTSVEMFYPNSMDAWGRKPYTQLYNGLRIKFHESPAFLFTYDYIREEFSTTPAFGVFYKKVRKRFFPQLNPYADTAGANANGTYKPIGGKWLHSDHPRPLTKIAIADMPPLDNSAEYTRARAWARKLPHVGEACRYPINGKEALARFQSFCSNKLAEYGGRQNYAIINSNYDLDVGRVLFHSVCSSSLNIGLITPKQVATELLIAYRDNHARIPADGFEIFFRQLMMREYMRVVYVNGGARANTHTIPNYFNAQYNMSEAWYNGTTGMPPIDNIIRGVLRTGYAHNTVRANWLCGWMIMQGIKPMCIYEWFLTMCVDAYPWITIPCVGGAYGNIERGYLAIKSSTWLTNMSNLKRTKNISWHGDWDLVYCLFIHSNANKLGKIDPKIVRIWKDKPAVERRRILAMARELLIERVVNTVDNTQPQIQQAQIQQAQIQHPQTEPPQIQQPQTEPPQIEQKINKK